MCRHSGRAPRIAIPLATLMCVESLGMVPALAVGHDDTVLSWTRRKSGGSSLGWDSQGPEMGSAKSVDEDHDGE